MNRFEWWIESRHIYLFKNGRRRIRGVVCSDKSDGRIYWILLMAREEMTLVMIKVIFSRRFNFFFCVQRMSWVRRTNQWLRPTCLFFFCCTLTLIGTALFFCSLSCFPRLKNYTPKRKDDLCGLRGKIWTFPLLFVFVPSNRNNSQKNKIKRWNKMACKFIGIVRQLRLVHLEAKDRVEAEVRV